MPGHQGAGGVLGVHLVGFAEAHADVGAAQQVEDGAVALEVGAGGVTVGVARALVALGEEGAALQILGGDAQFPADAGVEALRVGFGQFCGQAVEGEVVGVAMLLVELRRLVRSGLAEGVSRPQSRFQMTTLGVFRDTAPGSQRSSRRTP